MKRPSQSVQLADDLHAIVAAKAKAQGVSIRKFVDDAVRAYLEPVVVQRPRPSITIDAIGTTGGKATVSTATVCRCGHTKASHWVRGCVAGCPCRAFR